MTENERRVRTDSDELLAAVEDLRQTERRKRRENISTDPFHAMADEVEVKAREVWDIAKRENVDGDQAATTDRSIDETPRLRQD